MPAQLPAPFDEIESLLWPVSKNSSILSLPRPIPVGMICTRYDRLLLFCRGFPLLLPSANRIYSGYTRLIKRRVSGIIAIDEIILRRLWRIIRRSAAMPRPFRPEDDGAGHCAYVAVLRPSRCLRALKSYSE